MRVLLSRLFGVFSGRRQDAELNDEIQTHLRLLADDYVRRGLSRPDALLAARREFGGVDQLKETYRDQRGLPLVDTFIQDLTYAARALIRAPGFTIVALGTLALGIGANTAIFSVVNAVVLRALPYPNADRLVWVWQQNAQYRQAAVSAPDFLDYRESTRAFDRFSAVTAFPAPHSWTFRGASQQLQMAEVTADVFETLDTHPLLGRTFSRSDEQHSEAQVAILSYGIWQRLGGADRDIVGQTARIDGNLVTLVGVMPGSFDFPSNTDVWVAAPMLAGRMQQRAAHFLRPIALLRPGMSLTAAQADLDVISTRLAEAYPDAGKGWSLRLEPLRDAVVGEARTPLLLLFGGVGLVLLMACVNVANMLLGRHGTRVKEFAVRAAIGASRQRLVRQLVTESFLLAALAGAVALPMAVWSVALLRVWGPPALPRLNEFSVDWHVLGYTALLSLLTAFGFGVGPAWFASDASVHARLLETRRTGVSRHRRRAGLWLVAAETSLALCLLIAAALVLQSFWRTVHESPGFTSTGVITTRLVLPPRYADAARVAFLQRIFSRIEHLPGVQAVGGISHMPLSGEHNNDWFRIPGRSLSVGEYGLVADWRGITPSYFAAMGIPVLGGRTFTEHEQGVSAQVIMVDESFTRKYFPGENPLGKDLLVYQEGAFLPHRIIGIVGGVRHYAMNVPPQPTMYIPYDGLSHFHIVVRSSGPVQSLASPIREAVASEDTDIALSTFEGMDEVLAKSALEDRFVTWLFGLFAGLAVTLAAAGVFGVLSHIVTQYTHEIGVRLALGASPGRVMRGVLARGARAAFAGIGVGALAAFFLVQVLASLLHGVQPRDPLTFAGSALLLALVAIGAGYLPARRASLVDPIDALRAE